MPSYLTAKQVTEIQTLQGLDEAARTELLADATRVERYVARNRFIEEEDLRQYGERNDLPPDRLNAALGFLTETGRLVKLG